MGVCTAGTPIDCDDDDVCTSEVCDPEEGCVYEETWIVECDDGFGCTEDYCDPETGCYYEYICPEYCANGVDDDGDGDTDCYDSDCEESPSCTGAGTCEPLALAYCNTMVEGDLAADPKVDLITSYACGTGDYSGPEQTYELQISCAGTAKVTAWIINLGTDSSIFADLIVIPESASGECLATKCAYKGLMSYSTGYGKAQVIFNAQNGTTYYLVIDGRNGAEMPYSLQTTCECL